jgi:hypothetical protein
MPGSDFRARRLAAALACAIIAVSATPSVSAELKMFRERNHRGAMMVLQEAGSSISFSPRSLRVGDGGAWLICPRPFFGGQCKTVDKDTADLRLPRAFSGTVQSARPLATPAPPPIGSEPKKDAAPKP